MGSEANFNIQTLIFRLSRKIDEQTVEYQFDHEQTNSRFSFSMYDNIVELEAPSEEISLKKITARMRSTLKAKELLTRYFNS